MKVYDIEVRIYRRAVRDPNDESEGRDPEGYFPLIDLRKLIFDDADDNARERNSWANPEYEEHQEEENRKYLWYDGEFRECLGIGDECQSGAGSHDGADVVASELVSEIAEDPEDRRTGNEAREEIQCRHDYTISVK